MPGPVLFLQLLYRLVKARGGKAGRHTHSCHRAKRQGRAQGMCASPARPAQKPRRVPRRGPLG